MRRRGELFEPKGWVFLTLPDFSFWIRNDAAAGAGGENCRQRERNHGINPGKRFAFCAVGVEVCEQGVSEQT